MWKENKKRKRKQTVDSKSISKHRSSFTKCKQSKHSNRGQSRFKKKKDPAVCCLQDSPLQYGKGETI